MRLVLADVEKAAVLESFVTFRGSVGSASFTAELASVSIYDYMSVWHEKVPFSERVHYTVVARF